MKETEEVINRFINNDENTMNAFLTRSVAMVLIKLSNKYLATDEANRLIGRWIEDIDDYIKSCFPGDNDLKEAVAWIKTPKETNELDIVTVLLDDNEEKRVFPLREVFALVGHALMDNESYDDQSDRPENDLYDRMLTLFNTLKELHENPVCNVGIRHDLVMTLNGVYPGVNIVEDLNAFLHLQATSYFEEQLRSEDTDNKDKLLWLWIKNQFPDSELLESESNKLASFLESQKTGLTQHFAEVCLTHGFRSTEDEVEKKITAILKTLEYLTPPVGINPLAISISQLINLKADKGTSQAAALKKAKELTTSCETLAKAGQAEVGLLVRYESIYQELKRYRSVFGVGIDADLIKEVSEAIDSFFSSYAGITELSNIELVLPDEGLLQKFDKAVLDYKADKQMDFIGNFFATWSIVEPEERYKLYKSISGEEMRAKILLSDDLLGNLPQEGEEIQVSPYDINRVLLHAFLETPTRWSETFYVCVNTISRFIDNNFNLEAGNGIASNLSSISYPEVLRKQLKVLISIYQRIHLAGANEEELEAEIYFPANVAGVREIESCKKSCFAYAMPVIIGCKKDIFNGVFGNIPDSGCSIENQCRLILASSTQETIQEIIELLGEERLGAVIQDGVQLGSFLSFLPKADRRAFIELLGKERLRAVIQNGRQLGFILSKLPEADLQAFIELLGAKWLRVVIRNSDQLGWVLLRLPKANWQAFFELLGKDRLGAVIQDSVQLGGVLSILPEADRLAFIELLGKERLGAVIQDGGQLGFVLSKLPETDRQAFIELLGAERLRVVIRNGHQLGFVLSKLPEADRLTFIELLGKDRLGAVIQDSVQLGEVLAHLPETDRWAFTELLGAEWLRAVIQGGGQLGWVLEKLPEAYRQAFIELLGKERLGVVIQDGDQLGFILSKLPEADRQAFIELLGAEWLRSVIQDYYQLSGVLSRLPEANWRAFIELLGKERLGVVIQDYYQLSGVLSHLPETYRWAFTELLGAEWLRAVIQDYYQLSGVLSHLPETYRWAFTELLGAEWLRAVIQGGGQLGWVLEKLPEAYRQAFIELLGKERLGVVIQDGDQLGFILSKLPEADRQAFIELLGAEWLRSVIQDYYQLSGVLSRLPEANWRAFIELLGAEWLRAVIQDGDQLDRVLEKLPENSRNEFVAIYFLSKSRDLLRQQGQQPPYKHFYGRFFGYSRSQKIAALNKLCLIIEEGSDRSTLSAQDRGCLSQGRLKSLFDDYCKVFDSLRGQTSQCINGL